MTAPPHLVSGWPLISESVVGAAPASSVVPARTGAVLRVLYEPFTSCAAPEIWNKTPSLIDADVTDHLRRMNSGVGVGGAQRGIQRQ